MADIVSQPWFWPAVIVSVGLPLAAHRADRAPQLPRAPGQPRRADRPDDAQLPRAGRGHPGAHHASPAPGRAQGTWPQGRRDDLRAARHRGRDQRDQPPRLPPRREGVVARPVPDDLQRPDPLRLHHPRHRALFWWVWDADVAGVFAALGVTSIVVGLALQNAVGSIVSGLFLIFEAPFELGDWIETGGIARPDHRGELARGPPRHRQRHRRDADRRARRGIVHEPLAQPRSLRGDADGRVRHRRPAGAGARAHRRRSRATSRSSRPIASRPRRAQPGSKYAVAIPLRNPGDHDAVLDIFVTRLWYAARRAELHLDGDMTDDWRTPARLQDALRQISPHPQPQAGRDRCARRRTRGSSATARASRCCGPARCRSRRASSSAARSCSASRPRTRASCR